MTDLRFRPMSPTTTAIVTSSTATTALPGGTGGVHSRLLIQNLSGSATAFVSLGDVTINATTTGSMPVLSGGSAVVHVANNQTFLAAITLAGTTTLYLTQGQDI